MKKLLTLNILLTILFSNPLSACKLDGSEGIVPENNLSISEFSKDANSMTKKVFSKIIDRIAKEYRPFIKEIGGRLVVKKRWSNDTVNAFAEKKGKRYIVTLMGGLARHQAVTADGFALVVCHEFGHHVGGSPVMTSAPRGWKVSNEGQADYFATQKCFKRVFGSDDNENLISNMTVPALVTQRCGESYSNSSDIALCQRTAMAGKSLATLFQQLRESPEISFATPDPKIIWTTYNMHPKPQCRLDTYLQGALCTHDERAPISFVDHRVNFCNSDDGDTVGIRPRCWFNPSYY